MIIPGEKKVELERAYKQIGEVDKQRRRGIITDGERYNKIIDIWTHAVTKSPTCSSAPSNTTRAARRSTRCSWRSIPARAATASSSSSSPGCVA